MTTRTAAALASAIGKELENAFGGTPIELAGGLVAEQHGRVVDERDGQTGAGQLSAGELARGRVGARPQADPVDQLGAASRVAAASGEALSQCDVGIDVEVADQVDALKEHSDLLGAGASRDAPRSDG